MAEEFSDYHFQITDIDNIERDWKKETSRVRRLGFVKNDTPNIFYTPTHSGPAEKQRRWLEEDSNDIHHRNNQHVQQDNISIQNAAAALGNMLTKQDTEFDQGK